jgi:hypothetical protein
MLHPRFRGLATLPWHVPQVLARIDSRAALRDCRDSHYGRCARLTFLNGASERSAAIVVVRVRVDDRWVRPPSIYVFVPGASLGHTGRMNGGWLLTARYRGRMAIGEWRPTVGRAFTPSAAFQTASVPAGPYSASWSVRARRVVSPLISMRNWQCPQNKGRRLANARRKLGCQ